MVDDELNDKKFELVEAAVDAGEPFQPDGLSLDDRIELERQFSELREENARLKAELEAVDLYKDKLERENKRLAVDNRGMSTTLDMHSDFLGVSVFDDSQRCEMAANRFLALDERFERVTLLFPYLDMRKRGGGDEEGLVIRSLSSRTVLSADACVGIGTEGVLHKSFDADKGLCSTALVNRQLIAVQHDVTSKPNYVALDGDEYTPESECVVPVIAHVRGDDVVHCLIDIQSRTPGIFDDATLDNLVRQAEHQGLWPPFIDTANIDHHTKLFVRNRFQVDSERLFNRSRRRDVDLAMIIVDINSLKAVNDYKGQGGGHVVGDKYIETVAQAIREAVRLPESQRILQAAQDTVRCYRYGGDEFIILVEGANAQQTSEYVSQVLKPTIDRRVEKLAQSKGYHLPPEAASIGWGLLSEAERELGFMRDRDDLLYYCDRHLQNWKDSFYKNHPLWGRRAADNGCPKEEADSGQGGYIQGSLEVRPPQEEA